MRANQISFTGLDRLIIEFDQVLRTLSGVNQAKRTNPADAYPHDAIQHNSQACRHAAGLMRVNHVGEVCAQALYQAQRICTRQSSLREQFAHAAEEEEDHLAWCATRLQELGSRPSLLNPFWYAGAFAIGLVAGYAGDKVSLGFVEETEHQVTAHLEQHLETLPVDDQRSRAIVAQMRIDEIEHGKMAAEAGGQSLPWPIRSAMRAAAKVMTRTAYYI